MATGVQFEAVLNTVYEQEVTLSEKEDTLVNK